MTLQLFTDLEQGTDEWLDARRGIVTASAVGPLINAGPPDVAMVACPTCGIDVGPCMSIARGKERAPIKGIHPARSTAAADLPPVLRAAESDASRALTLTLAAERITGWTEDVYVNADMMRGTFDEPVAREVYSEHFAPVIEVGFMVRDDWGFSIGYSPDGLVGEDGLIEVKSRRPKKHLQTILADEVPPENMAQIQCGLLVSGRSWCDYVSFCGGMPLWRKRVEPDAKWFGTIITAVTNFEANVTGITSRYREAVEGLPMTERTTNLEVVI